MASCAKCLCKFFTPTTFVRDAVGAQEYLRRKFELRDRPVPITGLPYTRLHQTTRNNYFSLAITLPDCNSCSSTDWFARKSRLERVE